MDLAEEHAIRTVALRDVLDGADPDYVRRFQFRWYSKTFAVPLPDVADLPLQDVLQAFWEERYEEMRDGDDRAVYKLHQEARRLSLDAAAWREAAKKEDVEEARTTRELRQIQEEEHRDREAVRQAAERVQKAAERVSALADQLPDDVDVSFTFPG